MSSRPVIGVDAGGTKLLAGVLQWDDRDLSVDRRVRRLWSGGDRAEVLDVMVEAVSEARTGTAVEAVGFGIPSLIDQERVRNNLEAMLGTEVDLAVEPLRKPRLRQRVEAEAVFAF